MRLLLLAVFFTFLTASQVLACPCSAGKDKTADSAISADDQK